ncbi:MAG TPA: Bpu10I family restriction endonuclease, partial [Verrucomicrobiae bacterium]|nr:Bpu10I family restriction endonuclease [Verrucomicrobiae bacterium]
MFVHGNNLAQKESASRKYNDEVSTQLIAEVRLEYNKWKEANLALKGPYSTKQANDIEVLQQRVNLFEDYKTFIDQQKYAEAFDSRSNLQSSVLEEFLYYLLKDLVESLSFNA